MSTQGIVSSKISASTKLIGPLAKIVADYCIPTREEAALFVLGQSNRIVERTGNCIELDNYGTGMIITEFTGRWSQYNIDVFITVIDDYSNEFEAMHARIREYISMYR